MKVLFDLLTWATRPPSRRAFSSAIIWLLFVFACLASPAHAGHYVPHYSGGTAADEYGSHPYDFDYEGWWAGTGGAISSSPRQNALGSCTGQITTRFTWEPDYPGDTSAPPKSVLVFEEASATTSGSASGTTSDGVGGTGKRYTVKRDPGQEFNVTCEPRAEIGPLGYGIAVATVRYRAQATYLYVFADLGSRYISGDLNSTYDEKVYDGWVQFGYRDDGNPENPPISFWSGSATYSDFLSAFDGQARHTWSATGAALSPNSESLSDPLIGSSSSRFVEFDFGTPSLGVSLSQLAAQFPKTTEVTVGVTGPNPSNPVITGKVTVRWHPRARLFRMPDGSTDLPPDWFLDGDIAAYLNARRNFVDTGAALTGGALDLLYIQPAQDLMIGGLARGVGALGIIQRAADAIEDSRHWKRAYEVTSRLAAETRTTLGWSVERVPVLVANNADPARISHLDNIGFYVRKIDDLPFELRPANATVDVMQATGGLHILAPDEITEALRNMNRGFNEANQAIADYL